MALASIGKAYVGRNDGKVQQIRLSAGGTEGDIVVAEGATVFDPTLDVDPITGADRLVVVAGGKALTGQVTRLKLPLCDVPPSG